VPSATLSLSDPLKLPGRLSRLYSGYHQARAIFKTVKPKAVVGFGGYPSFPPILAASRMNIPCCVHDQNAVMGRANRVLAGYATRVASSFRNLQGLPDKARGKLTLTGNPVRDLALAERAAPYPQLTDDGPFNLLVFGGSQGARFFGEFMPKVIAAIPENFRKRLRLVQQVRAEDMVQVKSELDRLGIAYEINPFFMDMPKRIAAAHLVLCRSGASTIAELGVIGRPAIMVPLPHALDNDQLRNAENFAAAGAGWVRPQAALQPAELAKFIVEVSGGDTLPPAARAALACGVPDAAKRLADLTEELTGKIHP
jgi:UDP-N-acetylglucosamine--N-acetylmuramyl-(pentapeptide) pyrophosphoryl-undecaprenol N-acetylglucosamine transferase